MKSICFFNNKGGVGKTTLSLNISSYVAKLGYRVLFVDADPQANSSQIVLPVDKHVDVYRNHTMTTLLDYFQPLYDGDSQIKVDLDPVNFTNNRFIFDLVPGHPKVSTIEDRLSEAWSELRAGKLRGFRITNWFSDLKRAYSDRYDFVFIDVGPSLGALNRSILLNSDYFITPMGCDLFSIMGIENISTWISGWEKEYSKGLELLEEDYDGNIPNYNILKEVTSMHRFAGFSLQQYITKVISGERRGIKAYDTIVDEMPSEIETQMSKFYVSGVNIESLNLGHIPHLFSLVPLAQTNNTPIHELESSDGIVGNHYKMVKDYNNLMEQLCSKLLKNVGGKEL